MRAFLLAVSLVLLEGSCCHGVGMVQGQHICSCSCQTKSTHTRGRAERGRITELLALSDRSLEFALPAVKPYHAVLWWHLSWAANPGCFNCTCAACVLKFFHGQYLEGAVRNDLFADVCCRMHCSDPVERQQPSSGSQQPLVQVKKGTPILQAVAEGSPCSDISHTILR